MQLRSSVIALGAAAFLLAAAAAHAQTPASRPDESAVVQELEVIKHLPGPALWKASKGDAELFILGAVSPVRHLQTWDQSRLANAMDDAVVLLLPPKGHLGAMDLLGLMLNGGAYKLPHGRTLKQVLPPQVWAELSAKIVQVKGDPKKYANLKPALAGVMLIGDFRKAAGLSDAKPASTVVKLARDKGVPSRAVADYNLRPVLDLAAKLSDAANLACLQDAMAEMDYEAANAYPAGAAWSTGDLAGVRTHYTVSRLEKCVQQAPSLDVFAEKATADSAQALNEVLNRPGKVVAVVDLALLLRPNGVLDRLKAAGAQVTVPNR